MVIGIFSDTFLPVINGVGRVASEYAANLYTLGHEVHVVAPYNPDAEKVPFEIDSYKSRKNPFVPGYYTGIPSADRDYRKRIMSVNFDIIHTHSLGVAGNEAAKLAEMRGIPLIGSFHTDYYSSTLNATGNKAIASFTVKQVLKCCSRCDEVWPVSDYALKVLKGYGYDGKAAVMRNGTRNPVISKNPDAVRNTFGVDAGTRIILYAGEINIRNKNIELLFQAVRKLNETDLKFMVVFAGRGRDAENLNKMIRAGYLRNTEYAGNIFDTGELDSLYAASDLLVFPSLTDTEGMVVYESAACGTPSAVVRGTAPASRIVNNENGIVCRNNAEELSAEIYKLLKNNDELVRVSVNARETLPLYWNQAIADVYENYERVLAESRRR